MDGWMDGETAAWLVGGWLVGMSYLERYLIRDSDGWVLLFVCGGRAL